MNQFLGQFEQTIAGHGILPSRQTLLIAVSGGLDSMVLLHLLTRLSATHQWRLIVLHFNHQLRGKASNGDENFVRRAAQRYNLPIEVGRGDVPQWRRRHKISIEMAARQLRYGFFASAAHKSQAHTIVLAHHADDQVELFFLRLLRGTGGRGLAGMEWQSELPGHPELKLARPLLEQPKSALREYARLQKIAYREDTSNNQIDIPRNRIRHELLPLLTRHYQPALARIVHRLRAIIGAEARFTEEAARQWLAHKETLNFATLHEAVQRQLLQIQLVEHEIEPDFELIEKLRLQNGIDIMVTPEMVVSRDRSGLLHYHRTAQPDAFNEDTFELQLSKTHGQLAFGRLEIEWRLKSYKMASGIDANQAKLASGLGRRMTEYIGSEKVPHKEVFDAGKVGTIITLRYWQPGDRFQPIGLPASVKLQDYFTNEKVPRPVRRQLCLAATERGEIFWVEGLRIAERFKLDKQTKRCLIWQWQRIERQ